jgi:hypothetical protein
MRNIRTHLGSKLGEILFSLLSLLVASNSNAQGIIELSINGAPLAEKTVIDYIDNNREYSTDSKGRLQTEGSCPAIQYTDNNGMEFRMLQFCGVSSEVPVYKFELAEVVTLSGRIEADQLCLCQTRFLNLKTGLSYNTGNGLFVNTAHNFSEKLPAGPYRLVVESNTWPAPSEEGYVIASIGVDAREGNVENIKLEISANDANRFGNVPPRGNLIFVEHKEGEQFSTVQGSPGTALPLVPVSLLNIQTGQATTSMSEQDGSFSIEFFSPPGSYLQVTQDIHAVAYGGFTSSSPGTVIFVPFESQAKNISTAQRLNGSSKTPLAKDLAVKGGYDPGIAWIYGEMDSSNWEAGDAGVITGKIEIFSRNLNENSAIELKNGDAYLELIFSADGEQTAAAPENSSSDMTVTGLPIDRSEPIWAEGMAIGSITLSNYRFIEDGKGIADWELLYSVPNLAPDGIYQLILSGQGWSMNPIIAGLDSDNLYYENVFGEPSFHLSTVHGAARITIGEVKRPRLYSALLMNSFSNGSRGVVAAEDKGKFGISGRLVTNADSLIVPPSGKSDTNTITYNIEPFIPLTAYSNKEWISNPKVPFKFSSGSLKATLKSPDGSSLEIGPYPILGSYLQKAASAIGEDLHRNSNAPDLHYGLTTYRDEFNVALSQYGDYEIVLDGEIEDIYGLSIDINGTYSISVAETLDFETGVFPGTPFEIGDQFSSSIVVQPGVPADVSIEITHYPYSAKSNAVTSKYEGSANRYGYYASAEPPFQFDSPGEYKVSYELSYLDSTGKLWRGSRKWGSVVETSESQISAKGARGSESGNEKRQWYLLNDTQTEQNSHFFSPYQTGDVIWTMNETSWNAAMQNITSIEDAGTSLASLVSNRTISNRNINGSLALVSSIKNDYLQEVPPYVDPNQEDIHWGYYYSANGRPGVGVREFVGTAQSSNGYWRFNTPYGYQLGNGFEGDQPNDFKFLFGGAVYRAPASDFSFYGAYGSLWVMLADNDVVGGRVMPPFQGAAGGPSGGPLMTLKGEEIDIFAHPMGVRPGSILEVGDTVSFSAQIAPTLPSELVVVITSPTGRTHLIEGIANKVGYFYDPLLDFTATEAGVYTASVTVTHNGQTSAGKVEAPYPTGSILGADNSEFDFYVVSNHAKPAKFSGQIPAKLPSSASLSLDLESSEGYEITKIYSSAVMPGFMLFQGQSDTPFYNYDAYELNKDFPNLDLPGGQLTQRNGADTVTLSFLLETVTNSGEILFEGRTATIQGDALQFLDHNQIPAGNFEVVIKESKLVPGSILDAYLNFDASGDGDIYVALIMPDGNFLTLKKGMVISEVNKIIPFALNTQLELSKSINVAQVPLPSSIAEGSYKFLTIVTRAGSELMDDTQWLGWSEASFTFTK